MPECLAPLHYPQTDEQPFHQQLQQAARDYLASQGSTTMPMAGNG